MNNFIEELLDNDDLVLVGVANVVNSSWFNHDVPFIAKRNNNDGEWIFFHSDVEEDTLAGHTITIESQIYTTEEIVDLFKDLPTALYAFVGESVPDYIGNDNKEEVWKSVLTTDQLPDYMPYNDCIFRYREPRF